MKSFKFEERSICIEFYVFYRTQVSLGSGLWVPASVCHSESFLKRC